MSAGRAFAVVAALLAHAVAAATLVAGPDLGQGAGLAAIALAVAVVGGAIGRVLGRWTLRDAYREWALSRNAALGSMTLLAGIAAIAHILAGLAMALALVAGYLSSRDPPRASDAAFLVIGGETIGGVLFHAQAWQESGLFAVPTIVLVLAFAAREAWDLSHLAAPDDASRGATRGAFFRLSMLLLAGAFASIAMGAWLHAGGNAQWAPSEGARGILLALVIAGTAGAVWVLVRRRKAPAGPA